LNVLFSPIPGKVQFDIARVLNESIKRDCCKMAKNSLGFKGGLKGCERQLGLDRGDLKDIDGFFAVLLWGEYQRTGDQKALDTLLT
jgi:uncharacterized protein YprB with RNaseH-like and TPR domain